MYDYFHKYANDVEFFTEHIKSRLPMEFIDAHAHFNLPEHVKNVPQSAIDGDWAMECGLVMSYEDALAYTDALFPGRNVRFVALPWPIFEADTRANNQYIAKLIHEKQMRGLFTLRPEYETEYIEREYIQGGFHGFKPYPYMASAQKGAEVSIFDFMPKPQFVIANKLHAPVLMHLPRAKRLADPDNISEIRTILSDYPNITLILAHFGRCFNHEYFEEALALLGNDARSLWFDTAAVINPKVYALAFERLDCRRIIFGTDIPIMLWHGRREWLDGTYTSLCREDFSWNRHSKANEEQNYTFIIYEQLKSLLDAVGGNRAVLEAVFKGNAESVYA